MPTETRNYDSALNSSLRYVSMHKRNVNLLAFGYLSMPTVPFVMSVFVLFSTEILKSVAANVLPNLTVIGQCFAEISADEVNVAVFLAHPVRCVTVIAGLANLSFILSLCAQVLELSFSYLRQMNEVNGGDTIFVRCVSVCAQ